MIRNERLEASVCGTGPGRNVTQKRGARPAVHARSLIWMRVEVPEWRIVSEDLWQRAHQQIGFVTSALWQLAAGRNGQHLREPPVSLQRLLKCGVCDNALTICRDRLEEQQLKGLTEKLLKPDVIDYAISELPARTQHPAEGDPG